MPEKALESESANGLESQYFSGFALVAQWIEQEPSNLLVAGSIPAGGAPTAPVLPYSQGRMAHSPDGELGFDSCRGRSYRTAVSPKTFSGG